MWKINFNRDIRRIQMKFDQFIEDFFKCVLFLNGYRIRNTKHIVDLVTGSNLKIKKIVKRTKLKKYMFELICKADISKVYNEYKNLKQNYYSLSISKWSSTLTKQENELLNSIFNYFYNHIITSNVFMDTYCKSLKYTDSLKTSYRKIYGKHLMYCPYCDRQETELHIDTNTDHFLPISNYPLLGLYSKNLILSCRTCNHTKSNNIRLPIFHPMYNQIANYVKFDFDFEKDEKKPIIRFNVLKKKYTDERKKAINHIRLFKLNRIYSSRIIAEKVLIEKQSFFRQVMEDYRKIHTGKIVEVDPVELKNIFRKSLSKKVKFYHEQKGKHELTKLKLDLFVYMSENINHCLKVMIDLLEPKKTGRFYVDFDLI